MRSDKETQAGIFLEGIGLTRHGTVEENEIIGAATLMLFPYPAVQSPVRPNGHAGLVRSFEFVQAC